MGRPRHTWTVEDDVAPLNNRLATAWMKIATLLTDRKVSLILDADRYVENFLRSKIDRPKGGIYRFTVVK